MKTTICSDRIVGVLRKLDPALLKQIEDICAAPDFTQTDIARIWDMCELLEHRTIVFVASCLLLYSPHSMYGGGKATKGLVKAMALCKGVTGNAISHRISDARVQYTAYAGIKYEVDKIVQTINNEI